MSRLLPFSPEQITEAATLASVFTANYGTHRYDESPEDYLQRLDPMMTPQLRDLIARTAADPATLVQRRRLQQTSTGQARHEAIRTIDPVSITIVTTTTQQITTAHATRRETTRYALTLTPSSHRWQVSAIEPAAGQLRW